MHPVYIQAQRRIIHVLRNVDLTDARQPPDLAGQVLRDPVALLQLRTAHLHIDGRRHPHVQDRVYHRAAGEESPNLRIVLVQFILHLLHVIETAALVVILQLHLHGGRVFPGIGGVQRGEIRYHSNVGDHQLEVLGINGLPDQVLHLGHILLGHFNARPGGRLEVDGELPGVSAREKGQAQKGVNDQAGQK